MKYNILRPWETLDKWQKDYIATKGWTFLLCGRQSGKSTAASIKFGDKAAKVPNSTILMIAYTEKQAFWLFTKTLLYLQEKHYSEIVYGKDKPTQHRIKLKNGSTIYCYAAGNMGYGLVGLTITDLVVDEAADINRQVFTLLTPTLSVTGGNLHLLSTPRGKEGYFYECSDDPMLGDKIKDNFTRFYVSAEDCPRHSKKFLDGEKKAMTELEYAQEYLAQFLDELKRLFPDQLLDKCCTLKRGQARGGKYYLGMDIAGMGEDLSTFEIICKIDNDNYEQVENITTEKKYTTETSKKAKELHEEYKFKRIGVDSGGLGFGVFSELLYEDKTKGKVVELNNSSRAKDSKKGTSKLLKEEMYVNLKMLMEQNKIKLLKDNDLIYSLKSVQWENVIREGHQTKKRIFGRNTHIAEGLIRSAWLAYQDKTLNIWAY